MSPFPLTDHSTDIPSHSRCAQGSGKGQGRAAHKADGRQGLRKGCRCQVRQCCKLITLPMAPRTYLLGYLYLDPGILVPYVQWPFADQPPQLGRKDQRRALQSKARGRGIRKGGKGKHPQDGRRLRPQSGEQDGRGKERHLELVRWKIDVGIIRLKRNDVIIHPLPCFVVVFHFFVCIGKPAGWDIKGSGTDNSHAAMPSYE